MANEEKRPLKAFLCHASGDKPPVRDLYKRLTAEGVDAWLDQEKLLPGQDWRLEIPKAVHEADVVVVCLSKKSITKEGYVQKEIKFALDIAEEKPEGTIFLIPARLEDCVVPERLSRWQWVDLYEENGFIKLLRSLKLRANLVGAAIEPVSYEDTDKERERRLDQLYTEGLAAFYTEDWDRACHRFQTILSERPNHKNAAEKLAEAECQRKLAKLYSQSMEAYRSENWSVAFGALEELAQKSADYKDVTQLLKNARKQKQLKELYAEARTLHTAQKWQAVVKVFEQISVIEPNYSDSDELLSSAQKEVAEVKRIEDLKDLYSRAVREMDSGQWIEARNLLEQVHKAQTGFLETERLLRKVEDEITKLEERNQRIEQINILYEQAHGLLRSKKWRKALDKIEEIEKLGSHFEDQDGIAQRAKTELAREEKETQKQNQLAAMYAEAVRLLKEEKYQEALDKWQEVKAVDPKYPDRQGVQKAARKKLAETVRPVPARPGFVISKSLWVGVGIILVIAVLFVVLPRVIPVNETTATPIFIIIPTNIPVNNTVSVATNPPLPQKTSVPQSVTALPTTRTYSELMYDDFDESDSYNKSLWEVGTNSTNYAISQEKGKLAIRLLDQAVIFFNQKSSTSIREPTFFEARLFLDPKTTDKASHFFIVIENGNGYSNCGIFRTGDSAQQITCWSEYYGVKAETPLSLNGLKPGWHMLRFEIDPKTMNIYYIIDGQQVASFNPRESIPDHFNAFKTSSFSFQIGLNNFGPSKAPVGYVDFVRMGSVEDDPLLFFDDFNGPGSDNTYRSIPGHLVGSGYQGVPKHTFELLDRCTVLRLRNNLQNGQSVGWRTSTNLDSYEYPFRLEVRFNTLVQSSATSIDGFLEVGLVDGANKAYNRVGFFAGNFGRENMFAGYELKDNTWYRLALTAVKGKDIKAELYDDESGKLLAATGVGGNDDLFRSGVRIGLGQFMGSPGRTSPTDVAIDWIRLAIIPTP